MGAVLLGLLAAFGSLVRARTDRMYPAGDPAQLRDLVGCYRVAAAGSGPREFRDVFPGTLMLDSVAADPAKWAMLRVLVVRPHPSDPDSSWWTRQPREVGWMWTPRSVQVIHRFWPYSLVVAAARSEGRLEGWAELRDDVVTRVRDTSWRVTLHPVPC